MSPNPTVAALTAAFAQIDSETTRAGVAVTGVQTRIQTLLDRIANAATDEELQPLLTEAQAEVAKLTPLADALTAMGTDPANPVPVPVPAPTPEPAPTDQGTGGDAGTGSGDQQAPPAEGTTVD